jgi:hypothetical protein
LVGRFQSNPKETHVLAVKITFRYMKGIVDYGLWYPIDTYHALRDYIDVDWAGIIDDRKITSGGALFLGIFLVS